MRPLIADEPVHVYRNRHRSCWSVRSKGKVVAHVQTLCLRHATFHVSQKGRAHVLKSKIRRVHAYIKGEIVLLPLPQLCWTQITYQPFLYSTFTVSESGRPVTGADMVLFKDHAFALTDGILYLGAMAKVDCILDRDAAIALEEFALDNLPVRTAIGEALIRNTGEVVVLVLERDAALEIFKRLKDSEGLLQSVFSSLAQCLARV